MGSNIAPESHIMQALGMLAHRVKIREISTVYLTQAEGRPEQEPYYNCVVEIETGLGPLELKEILKDIEEALGRVRGPDKFAPRTIDLDLIVYDSLRMSIDGVILPDPEIQNRSYLAEPLRELAPGLVLEGMGSVDELAAALRGKHEMEPLREYTGLLRRMLEYEH